jgi:ribosomal protein S18 acetylase RimI-like enzyme
MKVTIKKLKPDHYEAIIRVWVLAKLPHHTTGRDSRKHLTKEIKKEPDLFYGAFVGKALVGVAFGSYDGRRGTINRLAVIPNYRRKGIAEKLVARCEKALRARGATVITTLIDIPNDGSVGLFKKMGFVPHPKVLYLSKRDGPHC